MKKNRIVFNKMLISIVSLGASLTYKLGSLIIEGAWSGIRKALFGSSNNNKATIEKQLDDLLLKMEEQKMEIMKLEEEIQKIPLKEDNDSHILPTIREASF